MDIDRELNRIGADINSPLRKSPDYGKDDILSQLAEHAGLDIEQLRKASRKEREKVRDFNHFTY